MSDIDAAIGARIRSLRGTATLDTMAARAGVSRAMLSRIERGESSPTAQLLHRVATGLGTSLAALFTDASQPLTRRAGQPLWRDPGTGYTRRAVAPNLTEVTLPAGATVAFDNRSLAGGQQVWVLAGRLQLDTHLLRAGDCLTMRFGRHTRFHNPGRRPTRYLVILEPA